MSSIQRTILFLVAIEATIGTAACAVAIPAYSI